MDDKLAVGVANLTQRQTIADSGASDADDNGDWLYSD